MSRSDARLWRWISTALFALALLLMAAHLVIYVQYAAGLIPFPFDYDQGEGFELVDTIMLSRGEWPYRTTEIYPFYASNYPPLFHVILVPFVWVFGEAYWYGRLAGFAGTLVTALAIGYAVHREERHRPVAVLAGLAFLASNYVYHVGPLFRQHMGMVMFETLAVVMLAHANEIEAAPRRRRVLVAGLLVLLAAGFTKQLALATCVAVFGFLFLRSPRRSIAWGIGFAAVAGGLFLWINLATHGAWWDNIIAANVNTYLPHQFVGLFKQWFRLHGILVILAGLLAVYELYFARLSLYTIWWVCALGNAILSGKWGAGDSYFATAIAATCLLSGLAAARTLRGGWSFPDNYLTRPFARLRATTDAVRPWVITAAGILVPLLYLGYGLSVVKMPTDGPLFGWLSDRLGFESSYGERYAFYDAAGWTEGYATIGHVPTDTDRRRGWRIVDRLRASEWPALSEEAGFSLQADRDVITNPTQLKNLYENDMFDPSALTTAIRAHEFSLVVFRAQFYPPPVLDAIYEAYYPAEVIVMNGFNYELWSPGPPQDQRDALASALATGDDAEITLLLPFEQAADWLWHTMTTRNWSAAGGKPRPSGADGDCMGYGFAQGERTVSIDLCPAGDSTRLALTEG